MYTLYYSPGSASMAIMLGACAALFAGFRRSGWL